MKQNERLILENNELKNTIKKINKNNKHTRSEIKLLPS